MTIDLSVVCPVYGNARTLPALHVRLSTAVAALGAIEMVFVDDACPHGSGAVLDRLAALDHRIRVLHLPINRGQHPATLAGLALTSGRRVAVLDADLQDSPEAVPELVRRLDDGPWEAVFAGRRGRYSSRWRSLTGRAFKLVLARLANLPSDAGGYVVLSRAMVDAVVAFEARRPYLPGMIAATRLPITSLPVARSPRPDGRSAHVGTDRTRIALGALVDTAWTWTRLASTADRHRPASRPAHDDAALESDAERQAADVPTERWRPHR